MNKWAETAFVTMDLDARAIAAGFDGLSVESQAELTEQLLSDQRDAILADYESRLGVDVSWARQRLDALI